MWLLIFFFILHFVLGEGERFFFKFVFPCFFGDFGHLWPKLFFILFLIKPFNPKKILPNGAVLFMSCWTLCGNPRCVVVGCGVIFVHVCVRPQMRKYVCQALPLTNTKCVCVSPNAFVCVSPNVSADGVHFARLPSLASLAHFFNSLN